MLHNLKSPCAECPFKKTALPGWLGPDTPAQVVAQVHSEAGYGCHMNLEGHGDKKPHDSYTVRFPNGDYVCVGKDLESLAGAKSEIPKKLCLTTGDIIFSDPSMVHIAAMYDRPERNQLAEEIVHRYNRYVEILEAAEGVMEWADTPSVNDNSERTGTIARLRAVIKDSRER